MSTRHFIALEVPDDALDTIVAQQQALCAELGDAVRAVVRSQLHVTIAFLADRDDGDVPAITSSIGRHLASEDPFDLATAQPALFGGGRALALHLAGPDLERLGRVREALVDDLQALRLMPSDERAFRPHLTIVRARGSRGPRLRVPAQEVTPVAFRTRRVSLVASEPAGGGQVHREVFAITLGEHHDRRHERSRRRR